MHKLILIFFLLLFPFTSVFSQLLKDENIDINNPNLLLFSFINMEKYNQIYSIEQALKTKQSSSLKPVSLLSPVYKKQISLIEKTIPLDFNPLVEKYIEYYLITKKNQTEILLGLFQEYELYLNSAIKSKGLPYELKYIPAIRSAMDPSAFANNGTSGFWQFAYPIARYYGLDVDSYVDERRDYKKSTQAALNYLKDLNEIYKDWTLTLAAYNCGPGNVNKAIRRAKGKTGFWEIYEFLPSETRDLVPVFYAFSYVANYYKDHNLLPLKINLNLKSDTVAINYKISLKQVSEIVELAHSQLKEMNPIYKKDIIPGGERTYYLHLPMGFKTLYLSRKDSIFSILDSLAANKIPDDTLKTDPKASPVSIEKTYSNQYHKVKSGETLGSISRKYGVSISNLKKWNGLRSDVIHPGKKLVVKQSVSVASKTPKTSQISSEQVNTEPKTEPKQTSEWQYYTVKQGDNIYSIAKKYPGVSEKEIMHWNTISDPRTLKAGQIIKIKIN